MNRLLDKGREALSEGEWEKAITLRQSVARALYPTKLTPGSRPCLPTSEPTVFERFTQTSEAIVRRRVSRVCVICATFCDGVQSPDVPPWPVLRTLMLLPLTSRTTLANNLQDSHADLMR